MHEIQLLAADQPLTTIPGPAIETVFNPSYTFFFWRFFPPVLWQMSVL